jgi:hypothetical protein
MNVRADDFSLRDGGRHAMKSKTLRGRAVTGGLRFDPCSIEDVVTSEHHLTLHIIYVGGCRTHSFDLLEERVSRRAGLVVIDLIVVHDAQGDDCKSLIREEHIFDLSALEDEHRDLASSQMRLRLRLADSTRLYEV